MEDKSKENSAFKVDIDLTETLKVLWGRRSYILKVIAIFSVLGIAVAFTSPKRYETNSKLLPEVQNSGNLNIGGISGLAGLAGIDLGRGGSNSLSPQLYSDVVKSVPFIVELLNEPIYYQELDTTISTYVFLRKFKKNSPVSYVMGYTIGLPGKIKSWMSPADEGGVRSNADYLATDTVPLSFSKLDRKIINDFRNSISVNINTKTNVVDISVILHDKYASALMNKLIVDKLSAEITDYNLEKIRENLEFIEQRYQEAEEKYLSIQRRLAIFTNNNRDISSAVFQLRYQNLQNDLNLAFDVYKGLATQLEQVRIKEKEQTPIFTVIEPVNVPNTWSKPNRLMIIFVFILLGTIVGCALTLIKKK